MEQRSPRDGPQLTSSRVVMMAIPPIMEVFLQMKVIILGKQP